MKIETSTHADFPKGAPFIVEKTAFGDGDCIDVTGLSLDDAALFDWPMVYVLSNDEEAYVGQTTSVVNRMAQHNANPQKQSFNYANLIYNEEFNSSVVTDYEHRIIQLMHADGKYTLTNKNEGMSDSNYFSKEKYAQMFDDLWEELRKYELADHSIASIEESEVFKYSPFKCLSADQKAALDKIIIAIKNGLENAKPIVVEGMPGTGKTILAVYLMKILKDDPEYRDLNIKLIEPMSSVRSAIENSLGSVANIKKGDIIGPYGLNKKEKGYIAGQKKCFDIVLVDEAHRLKRNKNLGRQGGNYKKVCDTLGLPEDCTQIDWVLDQAKLPIFFYDPLQRIGEYDVTPQMMRNSLGDALDNAISLESQMRVAGGDGYLRFVRGLLGETLPSKYVPDEYEFVLHDSFSGFAQSFESKIKEHSLTRMIAGYAWPWVSASDENAHDIVIEGIGKRWNDRPENWIGRGFDDPARAQEVGCIHSTQGQDLSYAYVVIGPDLRLNPATGRVEADGSNYFDSNSKRSAKIEDLESYIKNVYYVLLTRGVFGTHIYVCDPALREYIKGLIE